MGGAAGGKEVLAAQISAVDNGDVQSTPLEFDLHYSNREMKPQISKNTYGSDFLCISGFSRSSCTISLLSLMNLSQALQADKLRGWEQAAGLLTSKLILNFTSSVHEIAVSQKLVGVSFAQWLTFLAIALFKGFSIGFPLPLLNYDYFFNLKRLEELGCGDGRSGKGIRTLRWTGDLTEGHALGSMPTVSSTEAEEKNYFL